MRRFFVVSAAALTLGVAGTAWAASAGAPGRAVYRLYQSARKAQPGLTDPETAYLQCHQAP